MINQAEIKGTWVVVSAIRDGTQLSAEQMRDVICIFDGAGLGWVKKGEQSATAFEVSTDPSTLPKTEDARQIFADNTRGTAVHSIYEINDDMLTICSAEPGKDRPTEFAAPAGSSNFLRVYRRVENE